ncbi:MAG: twin-arginine translocase subunit TatC [bacterium]
MREDKEMTFLEHLEELRRRMVVCIVAVVIAMMGSWFFRDRIFLLIKGPVQNLVFIAPQEMFITHIKIAFYVGLFAALPVILFELWQFISVGLLKNERRVILIYLPASLLLFAGGVAFCYFLLLPIALKFLLGFAVEGVSPMISVSRYVSFVAMMLLAVGITFQMPLVLTALSTLGIITPAFLSQKRKYAILMIFVFAAIITPTTDAFTLILLAGPMLVLYEVSVWLSYLVQWRRRRREKVEGEAV